MIEAIIGHLVGDYLLQNDWMAANKKSKSFVCAVHCMVWTLSVCLFSGAWTWIVFAILFASHYIQDRTSIIRRWMTFFGQDDFATGKCAPWSIIVVDNVWHIVTIYFIWKVVL